MKTMRFLGTSLLVAGLATATFGLEATPVQAVGKTVMFDNAHCETCGNSDWVINGAYSDYATALRNAGYTVVENKSPLTSTILANVDVLVLPEPNTKFTSTEIAAINDFVLNKGKGLYAIADHGNSDRNNDGWDSTEIFNGHLLNQYSSTADWFGKSFGFTVNYVDRFQDPTTNIRSHAITSGVTAVGCYNGATFKITNSAIAQGLIYVSNDTNPYAVAATPGYGRVAALGDSSPYNDGTGYTSVATYYSFSQHSHRNLAVNTIKWLAKDL